MKESIFDKISKEWWDKNGPMKMLHSMNETRILFIKERIINKYHKVGNYKAILEKKTMLDLGCGGGILSETLAADGANILAIDQSKKLINEAKKRAKSKNLKIDYRCQSIESLNQKGTKFDIILCLEVIEHVKDYRNFINLTFKCLKRDGIIIFSTINKSILSYITTIFLAEKILRIVPSKTHDWDMYIKPEEIVELAEVFKFKLDKIIGLTAVPCLHGFKWIRTNNTKANYIVSFIN